ncbi:alpha/beta fold hydrolase [Acidocella sp.]|uniref:alpha/beta fold hydrolase n=1 Tax=Acidocella sp. TaxID=50710 RepID=UPI00260BC9AD|nr:alpha/beta hydrolase [Acidocella sp.]
MNDSVSYAFLHGGGQGSWVWDETIAALALQAGQKPGRTLALDVPGCGTKRGRDTHALGVDDIAAELVADITAAGMSDVVLVGHSQAGSVMPHMVKAGRKLFRRLVYVSCSIPLPGQSVIGMVGNGLHGENPDEVGWPMDPGTHSMAERFRVMFCNDMAPGEADAFLAKLGADSWPMASYAHTAWSHDQLGLVPASYVICLRDGILPLPWQERFAARFKTGRTIRIDAGHQAMTTRPHGLAEILRNEAAV